MKTNLSLVSAPPQGICRAGLAVLGLWLLAGCEALPWQETGALEKARQESFSVATWNLEALFDGEEAGTEYEDYRASEGWNAEKYQARLTAIAKAVRQMADRPPDVLAFEEVENSRVLEDLAGGELAKQGYSWVFFANNPGAALGLGVLSRFPFTWTRAHSLNAGGEAIPRPLLEIRLEVREEPLVLFVCHWKSKLGGDDNTEPLRRSAARVLLRRLWELEREEPGVPVIIMGDLNENHDEFYRRGGSVISALLPDDPKAAELTGLAAGGTGVQADFLVLSRKKPPALSHFSEGTRGLYSPWGAELAGGSYNYKGSWETIDHFLLNGALFNGEGWDFDSCRVLNQEPFTNSKGYPNSYNPRNGGGLSDHLPLFLTLKFVPE